MNSGKTIFSQIMDFLPLYEFRKCVDRYSGDYRMRSFSCMDQFFSMAFAQLTFRESLRDIEVCLRSIPNKLYHMGFRGKISRSTLADSNEKRDWRIYADFAQSLIKTARKLYANDSFNVDLNQTVYALDSTTIDLCLSLFPWAQFRKRKSAIKLHTLLDLKGLIPCFIRITPGSVHDLNVLDQLIPEPGSIYVMDRGYIDFKRLYLLKEQLAFFVLRSKNHLAFRRLYSNKVDKTTGLKCDQIILLTGPLSSQLYPEKLRRISYRDSEKNTLYIFLTNNFTLPAITVTQLYKSRWQIEIFFKWIKQHLRIKAFYGTSPNAVKTQIWIAISVYLLIAIIKKRLNIGLNLYTILQILSITILEKVPILQVLTDDTFIEQQNQNNKQLNLFEF
tara:strand:+ start:147 stop:1316 length:1170 start_codon:yes stop_codon:yes gene_type:complete